MRLVKRNKYPQIDRQNVQDRVALFAEGNTDAILRKYEEDSRSHEGHYVSADLMKEMFPEYAASSADRARYSNPVHNTATALADEQFSRAVKNDSQQKRDQAMFVTGVPGAGKSAGIESMVDSAGHIPDNVRVVYEGQLANHESAIPKIQECLNAGLMPTIIAVHIKPEDALHNTLDRFEQNGQGASLHAMATIQSNLPDGLQKIHDEFGEKVNLVVVDRSQGMNDSTDLYGWNNLPRLQEGNYDQLKQRYESALQQYANEYDHSDDAIRQANNLATSGVGEDQRHENDRNIQQLHAAVQNAEEIASGPAIGFMNIAATEDGSDFTNGLVANDPSTSNGDTGKEDTGNEEGEDFGYEM